MSSSVLSLQNRAKRLPWLRTNLTGLSICSRIRRTFGFPAEVIEDNQFRSVKVRYVPIGVTCGLVLWNYPLLLAAGKIASALFAGNSIIVKPSPDTPYFGLKLGELGMHFFPPGVLQVLSGGHDLGLPCAAHPDIDKISFTGSIATGKR